MRASPLPARTSTVRSPPCAMKAVKRSSALSEPLADTGFQRLKDDVGAATLESVLLAARKPSKDEPTTPTSSDSLSHSISAPAVAARSSRAGAYQLPLQNASRYLGTDCRLHLPIGQSQFWMFPCAQPLDLESCCFWRGLLCHCVWSRW